MISEPRLRMSWNESLPPEQVEAVCEGFNSPTFLEPLNDKLHRIQIWCYGFVFFRELVNDMDHGSIDIVNKSSYPSLI